MTNFKKISIAFFVLHSLGVVLLMFLYAHQTFDIKLIYKLYLTNVSLWVLWFFVLIIIWDND